MNKFIIPLLFAVSAFLTPNEMIAQNCDSYEIKLNQAVTAKDYTTAYPILKEALAACPGEKINFYNFGETILLDKIDKTSDEALKKKYGAELVSLIDNRIKYFPDGKEVFWEGEKITYQLKLGLLDQETSYQKYKELFNASEDTQKVSASTVLSYYTTALELMNDQKLDFEEVLKVYFDTKKVVEDNIELRSIEFGVLAEKLDSIKKVNPKKDLTLGEKQTMENAQSSKDIFVAVSESMESVLEQYTTCENIAPMFEANFEQNKDSIEWLLGSYQALSSKDCFEHPIMEKIEERYAVVWRKENPQAAPTQMASSSSAGGSTIGSSYSAGAKNYKSGNYSGAITDFKKAIEEVSGTTRGDVAYYIALSYQKTGNLTNAVSWAKRAASYKPGWGAPYQLISSAFGASANACGTSQFEKLSTYWVAADYANKACAVDSRSCSWAKSAVRSYEATAPSKEMSFQAGKKAGDQVSISCLGGATTTVR